jgi:hypothetical protein
MAKRKRDNNKKNIDKKIADGRGQGRGKDYKPWLHIQDVPSLGLSTRIKSWKAGRVHHFLSKLELLYFYILEWALEVTDIREQYPLLPVEETLAIAAECGIRHPVHPRTKHPVVMTTDFVVTIACGATYRDEPRTIKYKNDLNSARKIQKLEIERRYWKNRNIDLQIVTEDQISPVLAKNVEWVHQYRNLEEFSTLPESTVEQVIRVLTEGIIDRKLPLRDLTIETDDRLGLEPGTSLALVRYLLATRRWRVNLHKPINPCEQLRLLTDPRHKSNE